MEISWKEVPDLQNITNESLTTNQKLIPTDEYKEKEITDKEDNDKVVEKIIERVENFIEKVEKITIDEPDYSNLINIHPKNIILSKPLEQFYFESKMEIKNTSTRYIAFYIKKDKKSTSLTCIPSISFLFPNDIISINIKRMENVSIKLKFFSLKIQT